MEYWPNYFTFERCCLFYWLLYRGK